MSATLPKQDEMIVGVIGLGYVGLPLAIELSKKGPVLGFDIYDGRVQEINSGKDHTLEVEEDVLAGVLSASLDEMVAAGKGFRATSQLEDIRRCNVYIVTVPTPIDEGKKPDLTPLIKASQSLGKILNEGDVVIYESTTYPGCTEEVCVPELEKVSGLKFNEEFYVGYSPERINPGDKVNTLTKIMKVTSGSTPECAEFVDQLYASIIEAGTHKATSIKVAEASKAIENAQRDLNISFVNELALIFERVGIDTNEVIEAAGTKWNFIKYKPGLVGGHCISVDPYYLTYKAEQLGYHPAVILSGRRVNESMGAFVANKLVKIMIDKGLRIKGAKTLILGVTFKENCPDLRNTRIVDIRRELLEFGCEVDIVDPWADAEEVQHELGFDVISSLDNVNLNDYSGIILGVSHNEFLELPIQANSDTAVFDVKGVLKNEQVDARL